MLYGIDPSPDDFDTCIGLACALDVRSSCHATLTGDSPLGCLGVLCGLRRIVEGPEMPALWFDTSLNRLSYCGRVVDFSETEFAVVASAASGGNLFTPFESVCETLWESVEPPKAMASLMSCIESIRSKLWSAGIPDQLLEVDNRAGLRLSLETLP